jgi:hypothetical protein
MLDYWQHPSHLLVGPHRFRTRAGRFAAHVEDVGALFEHTQAVLDSARRVESNAAVRE